ncbi:MAG: NAD(P)H-hydrate dehydratase [Coprobacter sp.]|nr:NAD(P)H-hydrate dehydratase [Coprobacter sp.]
MKIFFTNETKKLDTYTIEHEPVSSLDLMERAAAAVTSEIMARWQRHTPVIVFAGPGNNGGDALAVARLLAEKGYRPDIYLFNPGRNLSPDCAQNKERLARMENIRFTEVVKGDFLPPRLHKHTLVVDGMFGSGLHTPLSGGFASIVQYINASEAQVVSIDLPSGLFGEDNSENYSRNIIRATLTLTFQYPKLAFLLPENADYVGEWKIIDIGIHPDILRDTPAFCHYLEAQEIRPFLKKRTKFAHKNDFGHALIVAGSYGMTGAAVLAAKAALHTGAGLVSVHSAQCGFPVLQTAVPEALFLADADNRHITEVDIKRKYAVCAVGPGIGTHEETGRAVETLIGQTKSPLVLDADALNLLAAHPDWLVKLPANTILTPHVREFDRLFGPQENALRRLKKAMETARRYQIIIVLKGAHTAIVTPQEQLYFNSTGNPGMATAGSGDALTGILAGLLSQDYTPLEAALTGVFLHGLAGDLAAAAQGQEYITAGDIIAHLGKAYQHLKNDSE